MIVREEVVIEREIEPVYAAFTDIEGWKHFLPDVLDVRQLYFDGYNQEFTMTVQRPAGPETVRGIRYCRPPAELELFQPVPPPGLEQMVGKWTFSACGAATRVVATRTFHLCPADEAAGEPAGREERFAEKLRQALKTNLSRFKQALEREQDGHRHSQPPALD